MKLSKWLSALMAAVLLCGILPALAEENVVEQTIPMYLNSIEDLDEIHLNFLNGQKDIPYVTAEEICRVLNLLWQGLNEDPEFEVTLQNTGNYSILTRENQASAYIDYADGLLGFSQYDRFFAATNAANMLDMVSKGGMRKTPEGGLDEVPVEDLDDEALNDYEYIPPELPDVDLILHESAFESSGSYTDIDLREYEIPTPTVDGTGYLPLQTFSDLFVSAMGAALCYNGEIVVVASPNLFSDSATLQLTELGELYYSVPKRMHSSELTDFTINELCLALDFHYSLKEEHGIESFREYFIRSGLTSEFLEPDPKSSSAALSKLCLTHFADGHSALSDVSPYTEYGEQLLDFSILSPDVFKKVVNMGDFYSARKAAYPDVMPGYEEVGNTAYVTFDTFTMDMEKDYYTAELAEEFDAETADTIELLAYAARQIGREDSPIENVVIDLSCNGGGYADVAMCVCSWALGMATVYVEDMANGAKASTVYSFDANLDHRYNTSEDSVNGRNLFCLISPVSFSCGNLVPASFRASGKVTLLGKASTGGACVVQTLSTADGALFCVSGRRRVNTSNNGIFYSVDSGVEPHYYLAKPSMFYDRQKLTEYINGLLW